MEWHKIEKEIKSRMRGRSIDPSKEAWQKLSAQLDREAFARRHVSQRLRGWISVAACLLLGGLIFRFVFNQEQKKVMEPEQLRKELPVVSRKDEAQENEVQNNPAQSDDMKSEKEERRIVAEKATRKEDNILSVVDERGGSEDESPLGDIRQQDGMAVRKNFQSEPRQKESKVGIRSVAEHRQRKVKVDSGMLLQQVEYEIEVEYRETKLQRIYETTKKVIVDISNSKYEKEK